MLSIHRVHKLITIPLSEIKLYNKSPHNNSGYLRAQIKVPNLSQFFYLNLLIYIYIYIYI